MCLPKIKHAHTEVALLAVVRPPGLVQSCSEARKRSSQRIIWYRQPFLSVLASLPTWLIVSSTTGRRRLTRGPIIAERQPSQRRVPGVAACSGPRCATSEHILAFAVGPPVLTSPSPALPACMGQHYPWLRARGRGAESARWFGLGDDLVFAAMTPLQPRRSFSNASCPPAGIGSRAHGR